MSGQNDPWPAHEHLPDAHQSHKLLFTVKPGGIAGYLGKSGLDSKDRIFRLT